MLAALSKSELRSKALESRIQAKMDSNKDNLNVAMELMIAKNFESLKYIRAGDFTTFGEGSQGLDLVQKSLSKNEANKKRGDLLSRKASFSSEV